MHIILLKRKILFLLIIFTLLFSCSPLVSSNGNGDWWNTDWSYRLKLDIPIDTSLEEAKYQPVDIKINFDFDCWCIDEIHHSIRVIYQENDNIIELESQIYDLNFSGENIINYCNLVFLIPDYSTGFEEYYVYYDDMEKESVKYPDHVGIGEGYYKYEPITGFPFESKYFKIMQDNNIIYGVAQEGEFLGFSTSQQVTKFLDGVKELSTPKDSDIFASYDYFYYWGEKNDEFKSTINKLVSKKVLVDGNLMVEFVIKSKTLNDEFESTVLYKYYYCPGENQRIYSHVKHIASKSTVPNLNSESFGNICGLQCSNVMSPSIEDLNFGKVYPFIHLHSEENIIKEYKVDMNPDYVPEGIQILGKKDDVDLGENAWVSFDQGESGIAHAIIFDSTNILEQGTDEKDGVQVGAIEGGIPSMLGLEADIISFYCSRNFFEKGGTIDNNVPDDLIIEFNANFFSTKNGGYPAIDKEAQIYQKLIKLNPEEEIINGEEAEKEEYTLDALIHLAPTIPLSPSLCVVTGLKLPFITADLYKEDNLISSDIEGRIEIKTKKVSKEQNLIQRVTSMIKTVDWKNITIFKKVRFENLEPGRYIIKLYRENPLFGKERKFIAYKIVDIEKNTRTNIYCTSERKAEYKILDQNDEPIENVKTYLLDDQNIIYKDTSDENGNVVLKSPYNPLTNYEINFEYKGKIIHKENIKFKLFDFLKKDIKKVHSNLYDIDLTVIDKWNLRTEIESNPNIVPKDSINNFTITPDKIMPGAYHFLKIPEGEYNLELNYKSFNVKQKISVDDDKKISVDFPAEYKISTEIKNYRDETLDDVKIKITRSDKEVIIKFNGENYDFSVPPGRYNLSIYKKNELVIKRDINIFNDRDLQLVANEEPIYPTIIMFLCIIFIGACFVLYLQKKVSVYSLAIFIIVGLCFMSLVQPWWSINGSSESITYKTDVFLIPSIQVNMVESDDVLAGEISYFPDIVNLALFVTIISLVIGSMLLIINLVLSKYDIMRISKISFGLGVFFIIGSSVVFYILTSVLSKIGVGSFIGEGVLNVSIIGQGSQVDIGCSWGPNLGFYIALICSFILILISIFKLKDYIKSSKEK